MNNRAAIVIALLLGSLIGAGGSWLTRQGGAVNDGADSRSDDPLYWVAPMDPQYRRNSPGKSPMGMDLVPVYAGDAATSEEPGTVQLSPDVIQNFGVRSAPVRRGTLEITLEAVGYVQYDEDELLHIHPRVEGWIDALHVKAAGDRVVNGEPLYSIYSPTLVSAQEELVLALKRDNSALIDAALARLRALQVPEERLAALRRGESVSHSVTIGSPRDGVLDNLHIRQGMYVRPGMEMMSIGVLDAVWVIAEIPERQSALAVAGDHVDMRLDSLPGRHWEGQVDYRYPSLNTRTRTAQLRLRFDNPDRALRPGMLATLQIHNASSTPALLVPREAVIRGADGARVVLALGSGRYRSVPVKLGRIGDSEAEVLAGLSTGEQVVTSAQFLLDSESNRQAGLRRMNMDHGAHGHDPDPETDTSPMDHGDHSGHGAPQSEPSPAPMDHGDHHD